jgi:hypothetical protein
MYTNGTHIIFSVPHKIKYEFRNLREIKPNLQFYVYISMQSQTGLGQYGVTISKNSKKHMKNDIRTWYIKNTSTLPVAHY